MRGKNSYWRFEKTGIDNADVRGEKFDVDAAVAEAAPTPRGGVMLGYDSPARSGRNSDVANVADGGKSEFGDEVSFARAVKQNPTVIEKLVSSKPISVAVDAYKGHYELNVQSAFRYVMDKLRGKKYTNLDTGEKIEIGQAGARKIASHDRHDEAYLRSFISIPEIIENGIFLGEEVNTKGNGKYDKYRYYACGLKVGNEDYTVRFTVGELNGNWFYDQAFTKIEKGELIRKVPTLSKRAFSSESPYGFVDKRLISLLQEKNAENEKNLSKGESEGVKSGDVSFSKGVVGGNGQARGAHRAQASVANVAKGEYGRLIDVRDGRLGDAVSRAIRAVSAMRSALPKSVRFNKALNRLEGVPSIGDIRRYMERVFNVPISKGLEKDFVKIGALGVYYSRLQAIRTRRGFHNDLDTIAHELGHYLDTLFFGGYLGDEEVVNSGMRFIRELEDYCVEHFGERSYKPSKWASEGWAQFISDVIKGDKSVAERCPTAFELVARLLFVELGDYGVELGVDIVENGEN